MTKKCTQKLGQCMYQVNDESICKENVCTVCCNEDYLLAVGIFFL